MNRYDEDYTELNFAEPEAASTLRHGRPSRVLHPCPTCGNRTLTAQDVMQGIECNRCVAEKLR